MKIGVHLKTGQIETKVIKAEEKNAIATTISSCARETILYTRRSVFIVVKHQKVFK